MASAAVAENAAAMTGVSTRSGTLKLDSVRSSQIMQMSRTTAANGSTAYRPNLRMNQSVKVLMAPSPLQWQPYAFRPRAAASGSPTMDTPVVDGTSRCHHVTRGVHRTGPHSAGTSLACKTTKIRRPIHDRHRRVCPAAASSKDAGTICLKRLPAPSRSRSSGSWGPDPGCLLGAAHKNRVGRISVRHMCAEGLESQPSPSLGWRKLRPTISTKSSILTLAFGSNE
jgi:hypothetical protein